MENLGAMADSQYIGFREITDRDVLDLQGSELHAQGMSITKCRLI